MFDSVREELQTKITSGRLTAQPEPAKDKSPIIVDKVSTPQSRPVNHQNTHLAFTKAATAVAGSVVATPQSAKIVVTADLVTPKTSPTLVGFQSKNPTLPDWRIQLQNAVQQRRGTSTGLATTAVKTEKPFVGQLSVAPPRAEVVKSKEIVGSEPSVSDPRVANALRRINESRKTFLEPEKKKSFPPSPNNAGSKSYKFDVFQSNAVGTRTPEEGAPRNKPRLISSVPVVLKRDTNKLPPIAIDSEMAEVDVDDFGVVSDAGRPLPVEFSEIKRIRIKAEELEMGNVSGDGHETEDIEDVALFSMRFGAGLFDLIIIGFATLLLLSPIAFTQSEWLTTAGLFTFAGVCSIAMFLYMTLCLGFYGKTMGMRLFSLELVDAVENEYPTLHQAAVSSSVYLLSLIFGGAGFLTIFFNEEKRAAHDLLSGTILVREF